MIHIICISLGKVIINSASICPLIITIASIVCARQLINKSDFQEWVLKDQNTGPKEVLTLTIKCILLSPIAAWEMSARVPLNLSSHGRRSSYLSVTWEKESGEVREQICF